jgi:hypothetical protein
MFTFHICICYIEIGAVGKVLDGNFNKVSNIFAKAIFQTCHRIVAIAKVARNTDLNFAESREVLDTKIGRTIQAIHSMHAELKLEVL